MTGTLPVFRAEVMSISSAAGRCREDISVSETATDDAQSARAFASARRHSAQVRWLRIALVSGVVGVVAMLAGKTFFRALGGLAPGLSVGGVSINGARITMNAPRLAGSRQNGEGYVITAAKAEQDTTHPAGVDLTSVEGDITTADHDVLHLVAQSGHYETDHEALDLGGSVRLSSARYQVLLRSAHIDFKAGVYSSDQTVSVRAMPDTSIVADSLAVRENGAIVQFAGHVKTIIHAASEQSPVSDSAQGAKP